MGKFSVKDIKAGYMLKIRTAEGIVSKGVVNYKCFDALAVSDEESFWYPLDYFDENLTYEGDEILAVYGRANSKDINNTNIGIAPPRPLLWERTEGSEKNGSSEKEELRGLLDELGEHLKNHNITKEQKEFGEFVKFLGELAYTGYQDEADEDDEDF